MRALAVIALVLAFPVLEAWVLFELGDRYGWWVGGWLLVAAVLGLALIRLEKLVWAIRLAGSLREQRSPIRALLATARTMVVGVLLIFPGVISDAIALLLWLWPLPKAKPLGQGGATGVIEGEYRREITTERLPPRR